MRQHAHLRPAGQSALCPAAITPAKDGVEAQVIAALQGRFGNRQVLACLAASGPAPRPEPAAADGAFAGAGGLPDRDANDAPAAEDGPFSWMIGDAVALGLAGIVVEDSLTTGSNQAVIARMRAGQGRGPSVFARDSGVPLPEGVRTRVEQVFGGALGQVWGQSGDASPRDAADGGRVGAPPNHTGASPTSADVSAFAAPDLRSPRRAVP